MAGKSMTWCRSRAFLAPAALVLASVGGVQAAIITLSFQGSLTSGSLAGTKFAGSFSYDSSGVTGGSENFLPLLSFDFDLLGVPFSRSNIGQGGQVIFHDALLFNVTAAFLANEPPGSPVSSIAFGFGGPGIIGYLDLQRNFGAGDFTIVPEPSAVGCCFFAGLGVLLVRSLRGPIPRTRCELWTINQQAEEFFSGHVWEHSRVVRALYPRYGSANFKAGRPVGCWASTASPMATPRPPRMVLED